MNTITPVAAKNKSFGLSFGKKKKMWTLGSERVADLAHEIGHAVAYLQNSRVPSVELTVFNKGGAFCAPQLQGGWRDQCLPVDAAEYCVAGVVFEYLYVQGDLDVETLYQHWLVDVGATCDREECTKELRSLRPERREVVVKQAIATARERYYQVGGATWVQSLVEQASVVRGDQQLVLQRGC